MLDSIIAKFGAIFFIILTVICGALAFDMMTRWFMVQNQAQFIAKSMGKYGGYTTSADQSLQEFASELKANNSNLNVQVSATSSVHWGTVVTSKITYTYRFAIGSYMPGFNVPLTGKGRSVSTYLEGLYSVSYTSPSY
ncbi:conserved hypothetical protein [Desulforamulus reducens MI-1]|uniref:Uncharacterized protein n=1 Tax=Desulforamulus reducens (strain ATCC BAA-1160 / DSM 100696 / MI-1) TaxID=349161 RepID=A4J329_DESRM|nr:hypothetical protein [Desulforamulus reducens]ABO49482.1 conserved hypothetical protein [Desulforamulus reducens MI-1]